MTELTIEQVMTQSPHTIGETQPLSAAHRLMNECAIRHLPVLSGGKLVGIVSQRDLHFIETLPGVKADDVTVGEAMSEDIFTVEPDATVQSVAATMAEKKFGCAVVVNKKAAVIGVFTTIDALEVLTELLELRRQR